MYKLTVSLGSLPLVIVMTNVGLMVHMVLVAYVIRLTWKVFKKLPFISFPKV